MSQMYASYMYLSSKPLFDSPSRNARRKNYDSFCLLPFTVLPFILGATFGQHNIIVDA